MGRLRLGACLIMIALAIGHTSASKADEDDEDDGVVPAGLACFEAARDRTLLDEEDCLTLCVGATSSEPVDCYERARRDTLLGDTESIALCRCATSSEPAQCFRRADRTTMLDSASIISMCTPRAVHRLWWDCTPMVDRW